MQDLIAKGATWFDQQRRQHMSVAVEYLPAGGLLNLACLATVADGTWESIDSAGQILRMETRDFFINRDDLPQDPKRGDKITMVEGGVESTYSVTIPGGSQNPWRWADRNHFVRRIHSVATQETSPGSTTVFMRFVGASQLASLTNVQIQSLAGDMATARTMERRVESDQAYLYVVLPESFGQPSFAVGGLQMSAWELTSRSIAFPNQLARPYSIYRSTYPVTGIVVLSVS